MNRRMKLIFTASLLLNIVFIGVGIGLFYKFCQEIPIPGQMTPEARHFIARTFQEGRAEIKPLIGVVKEERVKVEDILTQEKFDKQAYDAAVEKMLDSRDAVTRKKAEIMGRALVDLPAADRQKFSKRILDGLEGHRPRKRGYHHKMMEDGEKPPVPEAGEPRP